VSAYQTLPVARVIKEPADILDLIRRVEFVSRALSDFYADRRRPVATSLPGSGDPANH
jgi:hypothetical protein